MESKNIKPKTERWSRACAITSLILAIAPIIIWIRILIIALFLTIIADAGLGLIIVFLFMTPIANRITGILAIIFGILAIIRRQTLFSWLGIIIVVSEILVIAVSGRLS